MGFRFNISKATDTICQFLKLEGGAINIMKAIKLVYLLDRLSIQRRGIPVVGGTYFSLPNGPITSELLDLINAGRLWGVEDHRWEALVTNRQNHEIGLRGDAPDDYISGSEMELLAEIYKEHGWRDQWQLRDWTHEHCAEWAALEAGRDLIPIEAIASAVGKTDEEVRQITEESRELNLVGSILHS